MPTSNELVPPSQDPDTGLEIFPRLPELDDDENPNTATATGKEPLTTRVARGVIQLLGGTGEPAAQQQRQQQQQQQQQKSHRSLSGGHVYCGHTLDEKCRCLVIMVLGTGDYCSVCLGGKCLGTPPVGAGAATGAGQPDGPSSSQGQ